MTCHKTRDVLDGSAAVKSTVLPVPNGNSSGMYSARCKGKKQKKKKDREQKEGKKQKQYMRVKEKREIRR